MHGRIINIQYNERYKVLLKSKSLFYSEELSKTEVIWMDIRYDTMLGRYALGCYIRKHKVMQCKRNLILTDKYIKEYLRKADE